MGAQVDKADEVKVPVWTWRDAIRKSDVPPLTKLVCYTIANYLSDVGEGCFPSVKMLMRDSGLANGSVASHIANAQKAGLLAVKRETGGDGRFRRSTYYPRFPDNAVLPREPAFDGCSGQDEPHAPDAPGETQVHEMHMDRPSAPDAPGADAPRASDQVHGVHAEESNKELSTSPSNVTRDAAREGGEGKRDSGWAKGWSNEARGAAAELAASAAAHVITAFLDPVRGQLNPPSHVDAAAYVRRLGHELATFDAAVLAAVADVMLKGPPGVRRKRDLPDVGEIAGHAKAAARRAEEAARSADADVPPADAAVAARLAEVMEVLSAGIGLETTTAWFKDMQLEKIEGGRLTVSVMRKHNRKWIEEQLGTDLVWAARRVFPDVQDVVVTLRGKERRGGR